MTAPADCPWCGHARRSVDLLQSGDGLAIEHNPPWRGRECSGPSFGAISPAGRAEAPMPSDYAVGRMAGWREAIEVVQTALSDCRAEGVTFDRRGRLVALGALLRVLIEVAPR